MAQHRAGNVPDRSTTLAVVLGAEAFPRSKSFQESPAFGASARAVRAYLLRPTGLALPSEQLLDLFDSTAGPHDQYLALTDFLDENQGATDLLIYYVGHGGFFPNRDYFLAIHGTRDGQEFATALEIEKLAFALQEGFRNKRVFIILDCCFAGEAVRH